MKVAIVNHLASFRIPNCHAGLSFIIDSFSDKVAHVRDYREEPIQLWSITSEMYTVVEE